MTARMPAQRPGRSRQDFETPPEFIAAVKRRLGINGFGFDLVGGTPADCGALIKGEADRWTPIVRKLGIKANEFRATVRTG